MQRLVLCSLLALQCGAALAASSTEAQCQAAARHAYPAAHRAPASLLPALANCSPTDLYYGIGAPADPVRARQCALAAVLEDQPFRADRGVLMMVYANGLGVARDYSLARKAACEAGGAPAELSGRLAHLAELEAGRKGAQARIDVCDDATSGYMGGWCASVSARRAEQARGADFARLTAAWSARDKQALASLEKAARRFADLRSSEEVDLSGTLRGAFVTQEEARQLANFRAAIAGFERGALPKDSAAEHARLDARLNAVYGQLRKLPPSQFSTVRFAGIQQTQRGWLAYRDAWVAFGKVKYPRVPADAWRSHFTRERVVMLEGLLKSLR